MVDPSERGARLAFEAGRLRILVRDCSRRLGRGFRPRSVEQVGQTLARQEPGQSRALSRGRRHRGPLLRARGPAGALVFFARHLAVRRWTFTVASAPAPSWLRSWRTGSAPARSPAGMERGEGKLDRIYQRDIFDLNVKELRPPLRLHRVGGPQSQAPPSSAAARLVPSGLFAGERLREYLAAPVRQAGHDRLVRRAAAPALHRRHRSGHRRARGFRCAGHHGRSHLDSRCGPRPG